MHVVDGSCSSLLHAPGDGKRLYVYVLFQDPEQFNFMWVRTSFSVFRSLSCTTDTQHLYSIFIHAVSSVPRSIATADVPLITRTPVSACFCLVVPVARSSGTLSPR